ncbi:MAG: energy-coupling factor transporter transmembrane protein EcfT [Oscillospiraceae bacterium]|jgi:energy-coupling factor transport system permease protein|nr:energy-coupling factor transporter transmembrane protein EcfT [Oscillospiraceae bacterium]
MLKDITLGQYFPGDSIIHRLDSRCKIILDIVFVVMLFIARNFAALGVSALFIIIAYAVSGIKYRLILKSLRPILPLIAFTGILNLFFITGEEPIFEWQFLKIYPEGANTSLFMIIRIIALIVGMSLLTYTTSPIMLTDAIESLMSPLKRLKFPAHELAMMMTIALRYIPILIEETDRIMSAQKARGANLDTGGLIKRAKALAPIMIPLFVSAFKHANELAMAMECRCYTGGEGRTRLRQLKTSRLDFAAAAVMLCVFAMTVTVNVVL